MLARIFHDDHALEFEMLNSMKELQWNGSAFAPCSLHFAAPFLSARAGKQGLMAEVNGDRKLVIGGFPDYQSRITNHRFLRPPSAIP